MFIFLVSSAGLFGFFITLKVATKTKNIEKKLEFISTAENYNKNKITYREKFKGHKASIDSSGLSRKLVTDILTDVYSFLAEYKLILSYFERYKINYVIVNYLKKNYYTINEHETNQHLAYIIGRLSKEEKVI